MNIYDYKRAIRLMGDVSLDDKAVVVCRMKADGTVITANMGEQDARRAIYKVLPNLPVGTNDVKTTISKGGAE